MSRGVQVHIRQVGQTTVMSEEIVCVNYFDMKHGLSTFSEVGVNLYGCTECGAILSIKEPVLVHDKKGRLKMQVEVSGEIQNEV